MQHLTNTHICIDQGDLMLFSHFDTDGPMWVGDGDRRLRVPVQFSQPFRRPPAVHISISMWDLNAAENARGDLRADDVTRYGFIAHFNTWGDTKIARLRARWMAIGEMRFDDDWDV